MSSIYGEMLKVSLFGESHGGGIGVVIDGLPPGEKIDLDLVNAHMARRAPGRAQWSTKRKEQDAAEILSGFIDGHTCGTPLAAVIRNSDTRSGDYSDFASVPRPGHADYTGSLRYGGANDIRGGGHFSGRLTAPLTFAGALCIQILARRGIKVGARILEIAGIKDDSPFSETASLDFPVVGAGAAERMKEAISCAANECDSVGGVVECVCSGMPAGAGDPFFGGLESRIAAMMFSVPAVKGVEFGAGFAAARARGSSNNDGFCLREGRVWRESNNAGGAEGGITNGMPVVFRCAFKPTPSICADQNSIDLRKMEETRIRIKGRHDPCIVPRAVPVVESAAAVVLLDMLMTRASVSP